MVTANVNDIAQEVEQTLDARDIRSLAVIAGVGALGGAITQSVTDFLMERIGLSPDPSTVTEFGASIAIKMLFALALGYVAVNTGGLLSTMAIVGAIGSIVIAGNDIVLGLLTTAPLGGNAPTMLSPGSSSGSSRVKSSTTSRKRVKVTAKQNGSTNNDEIMFRQDGGGGSAMASGDQIEFR